MDPLLFLLAKKTHSFMGIKPKLFKREVKTNEKLFRRLIR